jgi:hypothetical protein
MACIDQRIMLSYVQILLDFRAVCFKFHDQINQWPISFQSMIFETAQGDKRFCTSWSSTKLYPNSNKCLRLMQGAYFQSHAQSVYQHVKISQGLSIHVHNHLLYTQHCVQISQGLPIDVPNHPLYTQRCVQMSRSSRWMSLTISYMRSATYKSAGAPDGRL